MIYSLIFSDKDIRVLEIDERRSIITQTWLNPFVLGGVGTVVEIDETHLGSKRNYNRGRVHPGLDMWVFGIMERQTKNVDFL